MVLVSDVMLCDWLVMVFSTWLTRPVSELTADVSAFLPSSVFIVVRLFCRLVSCCDCESSLPSADVIRVVNPVTALCSAFLLTAAFVTAR
ncbi:hypothetical protein K4G96_23150, partial [Mycobacterium tuberculosis]|nr:hypothetical protein [Mycobacterium tuberculosis]